MYVCMYVCMYESSEFLLRLLTTRKLCSISGYVFRCRQSCQRTSRGKKRSLQQVQRIMSVGGAWEFPSILFVFVFQGSSKL